jgi:predicted nuclease with TOPRIM domain
MTESSRMQAEPWGREREAVLAELTELVELQAAKLAELRADIQSVRREREELKTELAIAQGWVRELASRVEEAEGRLEERRAWSLGSRIAPAGRAG